MKYKRQMQTRGGGSTSLDEADMEVGGDENSPDDKVSSSSPTVDSTTFSEASDSPAGTPLSLSANISDLQDSKGNVSDETSNSITDPPDVKRVCKVEGGPVEPILVVPSKRQSLEGSLVQSDSDRSPPSTNKEQMPPLHGSGSKVKGKRGYNGMGSSLSPTGVTSKLGAMTARYQVGYQQSSPSYQHALGHNVGGTDIYRDNLHSGVGPSVTPRDAQGKFTGRSTSGTAGKLSGRQGYATVQHVSVRPDQLSPNSSPPETPYQQRTTGVPHDNLSNTQYHGHHQYRGTSTSPGTMSPLMNGTLKYQTDDYTCAPQYGTTDGTNTRMGAGYTSTTPSDYSVHYAQTLATGQGSNSVSSMPYEQTPAGYYGYGNSPGDGVTNPSNPVDYPMDHTDMNGQGYNTMGYGGSQYYQGNNHYDNVSSNGQTQQPEYQQPQQDLTSGQYSQSSVDLMYLEYAQNSPFMSL